MRSLLFLILVTGCEVGSLPVAGDGSSAANDCIDRDVPVPAHVHTDSGETNAGMNCMDSACHTTGGVGRVFTAAGTVYKPDKKTPNPGAIVRIKSTQELTAVADDAGNFYFIDAITFPVTTDVSACPDVIKMAAPLQTGHGACAQAGCHVPGTGQDVVYQ
jgi:hypothetical protein